MPCAPPATPVAGSVSLGPHRMTIHVHAAPPGPPQPAPASAGGATAASPTQKPPEEGWLPYFKVCGGVVAIPLMSFSYAAAHAQAGTTSTMQINDPECSWMEEMRRLNPVGCLKLRQEHHAVERGGPQARRLCCGPLAVLLFADHAGSDELLDYGEAVKMADDVHRRTAECHGDEGSRWTRRRCRRR
jgi:hypothetical protein